MEDKCYIQRKRRKQIPNDGWAVIRIRDVHHARIVDLCDASGLPISTVTTKLLDFALEHVELVDG